MIAYNPPTLIIKSLGSASCKAINPIASADYSRISITYDLRKLMMRGMMLLLQSMILGIIFLGLNKEFSGVLGILGP